MERRAAGRRGDAGVKLVGADAAAAWCALRGREPRSLWQELVAGAPYLELPACHEVPGPQYGGSAIAVLEGVVRGYTTAAGGRQMTLRYGRAGEIVGLTAAVGGIDGLCVEAVTPVAIAALSTRSLRELALREPEFAWGLAREVASASHATLRMFAAAQGGSTLSQVAVHLLEWTEAADGRAVAHVSHQQLAEATGTAREVVTRALASLRDAGVVKTRRGLVVVVDTRALERVASGDAVAGVTQP